MFPKTAQYAVQAMIWLARSDRLVPSARIALRAGVPRNYLKKILPGLAGAGLVTCRRGPAGGYQLRRARKIITILEIMRAVSGQHLLTLGRRGRKQSASLAVLDKAARAARAVLERATLDNVCGPHSGKARRSRR